MAILKRGGNTLLNEIKMYIEVIKTNFNMAKSYLFKHGDRVGQFIFIRDIEFGKHRKAVFECICGKQFNAIVHKVVSGLKKSCGCSFHGFNNIERVTDFSKIENSRHGLHASPEYKVWCNMLTRCSNKKSAHYKNYGGRGIKVCDKWKLFKNFYDDMKCRPTAKHMIERLNNDGDYEPSNCIWATREQQNKNTRANVNIEYKGVTKCLQEWAISSGISAKVIGWRIKHGWSIEDSLLTKTKNAYS